MSEEEFGHGDDIHNQMDISKYIDEFIGDKNYGPILDSEDELMAWKEYGEAFMKFCEEEDIIPVANWINPEDYKPAKLPVFGRDEYGTMLYSVTDEWKVGTNGEMLYFEYGFLTSTPYECVLPNPHRRSVDEIKSHIIHTARVKVGDRLVNIGEGYIFPSVYEKAKRDKFTIFDSDNDVVTFRGDFVLYQDILVYRNYDDNSVIILGDIYDSVNELIEEQPEKGKNLLAILSALDRQATEYEEWDSLCPDGEIMDGGIDATPRSMSKFFGKSEKTFYNWKESNPLLYLACEEFFNKH